MDTLTAAPLESQANVSSRFLKVVDVAELMDVPASTVYDLARQGRIAGLVRFGRHVRFDKAKLERWLEQGGEREAA